MAKFSHEKEFSMKFYAYFNFRDFPIIFPIFLDFLGFFIVRKSILIVLMWQPNVASTNTWQEKAVPCICDQSLCDTIKEGLVINHYFNG